jgi:hypothetical protein
MEAGKITIQNVLQPVVLRTIREAFHAAMTEAAERRNGQSVSCETESRVARHMVELARRGLHDADGLRTAALGMLPH